MAKEFVRNIKNTKLDSNEELKEPLYTNVQNDLLSDKKHAYIRNNDFYFPITKSILNVTEDSNIKNPLEYTKVIDGRTNEVTSHWNFNKLNNNFDSSLPITKNTINDTIIYDLDFSDLFNHFEFDNIFLSATQDKDNIKIKFTPDVIYEKTNQDMIDKLEYLEQNMGQNLTTNFRNEFNKKIDDEINSKLAEYGLQMKKDKEELKKEIEDKINENTPNNYQELINKIDLQNIVITEMGKRFDELKDEVYKNSNVIKQHSQDIIDLSKRISGEQI